MIEIDSDNSRNFYYKANTSSDGRATVITVLPMDGDVSEAIRPAIGVFVGLFLVALTITIIAFFSSHAISGRTSSCCAVSPRRRLPTLIFFRPPTSRTTSWAT